MVLMACLQDGPLLDLRDTLCTLLPIDMPLISAVCAEALP